MTAKRAWREMSERARRGRQLGFLDALGLLYGQGVLSREQVTTLINAQKIDREDLDAYRRIRGLPLAA